MIKRRDKENIRFLPLNVAMESFLSSYFNCFDIKWEEYSRKGSKYGLSPRYDQVYSGQSLSELENALRVFELHKNQVGVLLFVADALASIFIVPNPYDYKELHYSLLKDFYGETIYFYSIYHKNLQSFKTEFDESKITKISDFNNELQRIKADLANFYTMMANNVIKRKVSIKKLYDIKNYSLNYFFTEEMGKYSENYIGETIFDENYNIHYMKLYRISEEQIKRFVLLKLLDDNDWHIEQSAKTINLSKDEFILKMYKLELGHLLQPKYIDQAKKRLR